MAHYSTLKAWQLSHQLALVVSRTSKCFPREERYELTSQLRRAALSVPTNLVEGKARFGPRDYLRHVRIAAGSVAEVDYLLLFAHEVGYLTREEYRALEDIRRRAGYLVNRLARSLQKAANG